MRFAINVGLSLVMLALCVTLVWPHADTRAQLVQVFEHLDLAAMAPELAIYLALLVVMQLARSLRWNDLLAPLGVRVPTGPLLAISAVGFMAIVALPARLGELVRPGLLRRRGVSASAALGTVAVERIVDGLMVSLFVFGACVALRGPSAPAWMMPTAYAALALFAAALAFLICARRWPTETVRWSLKLSLLPRIAPNLAAVIEAKLHGMIRGFEALADREHFPVFVVWSAIYWAANGAGVWVLAHAFGLALSPVGAYAVMGLIAVGITLPNSPAMLGQFQAFMLAGLTLYLGPDANTEHTALYARTFAFANTHYVLQLGWYLVCGLGGLVTPWVSVAELRAAQKTGGDVAA
jgi:glycosyltransferase 2 family protein